MAATNLTEGGNQSQTVKKLGCSAEWSGGIRTQLIYISGFNIFFSITAVLGNTLILVALHKESSLHPPSKLLFRCLATTDLCVGLIVEPLHVVYLMSLVHEKWNLCRFTMYSSYITGSVLLSMSLLTLTAISVDRLLALLLGLRYRHVVTLKRTYVIVAIAWTMSIISGTSYFINRLITLYYGFIGITLCIVTSVASYCNIFLTLRHHQTRVKGHVQQEQPSLLSTLNIPRYKKTVSSALWVQLTLVACYLPYGIVVALYSNGGLSPSGYLAWHLTVILVFFNSSLNPFLYCWKIREVKEAVKETIREALCCLSP